MTTRLLEVAERYFSINGTVVDAEKARSLVSHAKCLLDGLAVGSLTVRFLQQTVSVAQRACWRSRHPEFDRQEKANIGSNLQLLADVKRKQSNSSHSKEMLTVAI